MEPERAARDLEAVEMTPADGETQRLRELHELYVWQVNAAVEEGRDDLVQQLADEYLEVALAELAAARPADRAAAAADLELAPPGDAVRWEVLDRDDRRPWWRRWWR